MTDFRKFAACRGLDTDLFFPLGRPGSPGFERHAAPARAVCSGCPVRAGCLAYALARGLDHGIFGGLDPAQRRALRASETLRRIVARERERARARLAQRARRAAAQEQRCASPP